MSSELLLKVNEIFCSIQGESSRAGMPYVFIRLTYCNLRCIYCDTEYAFYEGNNISIDEIIKQVKSYNCSLVEITGGEPLAQENVHELITNLCDDGFSVMLETGGSLPIERVDKRVKIVMDIKTPYSKMEQKNRYENIKFLKFDDEVKFVIGCREDYQWAKSIIKKFNLNNLVSQILMSPVYDKVDNIDLASWILNDNIEKVRFQIQLHKYIWHPETRGV